ncbi:MAG: thiamine phosphate synthase, partial [Candidatus Brocadia sp.]
SLPFHIAKKLLGPQKLIGISAHSRQEALQAQDYGADYITFGPVFDTPSKAGLLKPTGTEEIYSLKTELKIPLIALGGINEKNIETVLAGGADGVAVISGIMHADNPEESAKNLYKKIVTFKSEKSREPNFQITK